MKTSRGRFARRSGRNPHGRSLRLEPLEPRVLLSTSDAALQLFSVSPALFVPNLGQWADESVRFVHDGSGANVAMTDSGPVFQLFQSADADPTPDDPLSTVHRPLSTDAVRAIQFSASFVGANTVAPVGMEQAETVFNYHVGDDPSRWLDGVPSYEVVAYDGLYEGIDLRTWGLRSHLKYEFHVAPGADWSQIQVHYEGIAGFSLAADGSLLVDLGEGWGSVVDDAPYIYQEINGEQVEVAGRFVLLDPATYAFEVTGRYDPAHPLVIDPDLDWSTYLGGSDEDEGNGIAVDAGGVYVTGETWSSGWTSGGFDTSFSGVWDAFVAKLTSSGAHVWSTYLGGSYGDGGYGIALDAGGVYVAGNTHSSGWVSGGFDTTLDGERDAFVAKLTTAGAHVWSTYLGGSDSDDGSGIAVDAGGVYVTGFTASWECWVSGGFDTTQDGEGDAFAAKLTLSGAHVWSTYLGGSDGEYGNGIAVDGAGGVYVAGDTYSSGWVSGGFDTSHNGGWDGFVVKLTSSGAHTWSTYVGGDSLDWCNGIAVDGGSGVYVTGYTQGSGWVSGGFDTSYNGVADAFAAKLTSSGGHAWSTYLGGSGEDWGSGIAVDDAGGVYVTGWTDSSGWVSGGFDTTLGGWKDAFVAKLTSAGGHTWSNYLGGSEAEEGHGIAVDLGGVYVAGETWSSAWASGGFDTSYAGYGDGFVAKIEPPYQVIELGAGLPVPLTKVTFVDATNDLVTVSVGKTGVYRLIRNVPSGSSNQTPGDLYRIEAEGTDAKSSIKIGSKAAVKGQVPDTIVMGIVINGSLGSLSAPLLHVAGSVTVSGGVGKLALGFVGNFQSTITIGADPLIASASLAFAALSNVQVVSLMPLKSFAVVEWLDTDGTPDCLSAPWIGKLAATGVKGEPLNPGNFEADLTLSGIGATKATLGSARIGGSVVGAQWTIFSGAAGSISIGHNFWNSTLLAVWLKSLSVGGTIWQNSSDGDTDEICVLNPGFSVSDQTWSGSVPPEHWFGTLRAYVG